MDSVTNKIRAKTTLDEIRIPGFVRALTTDNHRFSSLPLPLKKDGFWEAESAS